MRRFAMDKLLDWKKKSNRKPLILRKSACRCRCTINRKRAGMRRRRGTDCFCKRRTGKRRSSDYRGSCPASGWRSTGRSLSETD